MKPGKSLVISFVLIMISGVYFLILSYRNKEQAENMNRWVIHTHLVIEAITNINTLTTDFESQDYSYVVTNNRQFKKNAESRRKKLFTEVEKIKNLTADNKIQQSNVEVLQKALLAKEKNQTDIFNVLNTSQKDALLMLSSPHTEELYKKIKGILAPMRDIENTLLKQRTAKYNEALNGKFTHSTIIQIAGLITLAIAFIKIYRESVNRRKAEEEVYKSEEKYKGLIENSSLIIFTTDLQGVFTYISRTGLKFTGYNMDEIIGKPFNLLIAENRKSEIARFYINQFKNFKKDLVEEFEIKTKDNKIKIIQLSTALIEEKGKIVGFQSVARNITEVKYVESLIKEAKISLRQQQEEHNFRMQEVLNNIPMALYIKDLKGRYMMVNKKFREGLDMTDKMIIGKTTRQIYYDDKVDEIVDQTDSYIKQTGRPVEYEEVVLTEDGERNYLITKFPLFHKNNEMFAISGVAKDITDMAIHRQHLIDARVKAEKAEQLQEAFLANMSHEIRTPMNGIVGMTNMLLDTDLSDDQKEYADLIKKSSDTLLILINDILDLSKIKAGRMELEEIDFNLKEAVRNVLQLHKVSLKKEVVLNYEISSSVPEYVKGDSHKLFQILNNLISNAAKFTEKGEIKVDINVAEKNDNKILLKFDVSDTGIGISAEHIKNIFENFTQAGNDTVRRFGGTGLGLAITKRLIELQNGNIRAESTPGEGAVFHVEIPYFSASTRHADALPKGDKDINAQKTALENKRILIVEDNPVNQKVLTSVLQKLKMQWDIANNGKEAIEIIERENRYDLIIMDLQMPVMDGFEAAGYIRKTLKLNIPILAMTASTLRNERVKCFDIGMNEYLAKPFSPNELIKYMHNLTNPVTTKEKQMNQEKALTENLYDLSYLHEMDDNDYLIEMLELFFESTEEMLEEINENIKEKNWDALSKAAHKIKSSLGPLQINKMLAVASEIEESAKNKNNLNEITYLNKELNNHYIVVKPLIEAELSMAKKISNGFVSSY